jgi:hypothetical protein
MISPNVRADIFREIHTLDAQVTVETVGLGAWVSLTRVPLNFDIREQIWIFCDELFKILVTSLAERADIIKKHF